jgi:hypothetical protein
VISRQKSSSFPAAPESSQTFQVFYMGFFIPAALLLFPVGLGRLMHPSVSSL